ncbi:MAG: alpha/beta fold hydrolase [Pseudomonadota bacterium]
MMTRRCKKTFSRREFVVCGAGTVAAGPLLAAPTDRARLGDAPVIFERGFENTSGGQLHFRRAAPVRLDAPLKRTVLCFHQTPNSSQVYVEFLAEMTRDRIVYAIDTPGYGESDLPPENPTIEDYASCMLEFIRRRALGTVDLVGYHAGASIAAELAMITPEKVNALMLVGVALFNDAARQAYLDKPWPEPINENGEHLLREWQLSHRWQGNEQSDASVHRTFTQKIANGSTSYWAGIAVMHHDLDKTLRHIEQPMVVVNPNDDLFEVTPRIKAIRPDVDVIDWPTHGFGIFEVQAPQLGAVARELFDQTDSAPKSSDE